MQKADAIVFRHDSSLWIADLSDNFICLGEVRGLLDPDNRFSNLKLNSVALVNTWFTARRKVRLKQLCRFDVVRHGEPVDILAVIRSDNDLVLLQNLIAKAFVRIP